MTWKRLAETARQTWSRLHGLWLRAVRLGEVIDALKELHWAWWKWPSILAAILALLGMPRPEFGDRPPVTPVSVSDPRSGKPVAKPATRPADPVSPGPRATTDGMILVPGGTFEMGSNIRIDEWGRRQVRVDAFFIDEAEVTNHDYARFLASMGNRHDSCDPREPRGKNHRPAVFKSGTEWGMLPVVGVDWFDAYAFAAWAGKALPTEAQWERAARGGLEGMNYPWGNNNPRNRAHFHETGTTGPVPGRRFPPNGYDVYDIAGNVAEWSADWYTDNVETLYEILNPVGPADGVERVVKGGSWLDVVDPENGEDGLRISRRQHFSPLERHAGIGFRCVRKP